MTFWTCGNIKRIVGGAWLARGPAPETTDQIALAGVSTDSRTTKPGQLFVALRGDRFDGHRFVGDAIGAGARAVILEDASAWTLAAATLGGAAERAVVIKVGSSGKALLKIAAAYRQALDRTRVVGVVGSNGKTTVSNLIASVLSAGGLRGTASPKSFNNAVGVPLTILSASPSDQYLVCEIGTNAPGEIAALADVVRPDIVVMTSIGREHLEGFSSIQGVAREEGAVLEFVSESALVIAPARFPAGAESLEERLKGVRNVLRFGVDPGDGGSADLRAVSVRHRSGRLEFSINNRVPVSMGLLGVHNAGNALAAFAVARRMGLDETRIAAALRDAKGPPMRLEVVVARSAFHPPDSAPGTFINDAYNANPDSMLASLRTFADVSLTWPDARRRVVILGDMLEVGSATADSHREIVEAASALGPDLLILIGPAMCEAGASAGGAVRVPGATDHAMIDAARRLMPGDLVLLKASRGMRLERVLSAVRGELADEARVGHASSGASGAEIKAAPGAAAGFGAEPTRPH
ncbi:MAG: UDP-N-acetylmuramoyl-tripeptide--D-alanyl-D-alanine ligase [Phycisphaerales bacterium]